MNDGMAAKAANRNPVEAGTTPVLAPPVNEAPTFLAGGGLMGARMRGMDWTTTPLGPPGAWPQSLKTIVRMMLDSRYAMWMLWGPELTFFCNDAYEPTLGMKSGWALGARSDVVWREIWPDVGPRISRVLQTGEATWDEALLLYLMRKGFPEETYHTFSYSPIYDDDNRVAGMLCVVTEVTDRVIGERRLNLLRDLAANASGLDQVSEVGSRLCGVLQRSALDTPFAALYLMDDGAVRATRIGVAGASTAASLLPDELTRGAATWPVGEVLDHAQTLELNDLPARGLSVEAGPWSDLVQRALLLPLKSAGQTGISGILVVGASPRRPFDENYRSFLDLIARQIAAAIAAAKTNEVQRKRTDALLEIDRAKTAFFSNISHEFRTPITLILGPLQDLIARAELSPIDRQNIETAHRNSLRLLKLVNSLLDFSRSEAGRMEGCFEATDLAALTRDLASLFRSTMERAGLTYEVICMATAQPVYVDRDMWEKICLNLLSNAFKFTLSGAVRVFMGFDDSAAVLRVSDTGVGIEAADLPLIFDRFHRGNSSQGRTHEGSGIGLALVKELVQLHHGEVAAASTAGGGTTMTVRIPLGCAHLPAGRIQPAREQRPSTPSNAHAFVQESLRWLPVARETGVLDHSERLRGDRRFAATFGARVLLADDNADMRDYIAHLLGPFYQVEAVADGLEALAAAEREPPAIILADVMMPRCDGFALIEHLRRNPALRDVPVILVSARAGEESRVEGLTAGADDYLIKPFAARELLARVGSLLELTQMRQTGEVRLRLAIEGARMATWDVELDSGLAQWSATMFEMLGLEPRHDGRASEEAWRDRVHGDDRERVTAIIAASIRQRSVWQCEYRITRADTGAVRWLSSYGRSVEEGAGSARRGVGITLDITDRKRAEEGLLVADRRKDEFLATLAHELRNPLAPIRNAARILGRDSVDSSKLTWCREVIQRQVGHMALLLDDLLDVSRVTLGRLHLKIENVEITRVIEAAIETARPLIETRGHRLTLELPQPDTLYVRADSLRLAQVIANLLTNAAKYTDTGGAITVTAAPFPDGVEISVCDTGIGIDPGDIDRVFTMFSQVDSALDRSQGGLGIGLALVKGLVDLHGGAVSVQSEGTGSGSRFTVRLPTRPQA